MIIGFQGIKNSYNDFATDKFIERLNCKIIKKLPLITSENVAKALINKKIDFGVIAIKNNIAGLVKESEDILKSNLFKIVDMLEMEINHCLFAYNENSAENLETITSHAQALKQCEIYLKSYILYLNYRIKLNFPNCKLREYKDTAKAAEDLKNGILSKMTGVICSEKAGKENNLFLVAKNIADRTSKTTFCFIKLK